MHRRAVGTARSRSNGIARAHILESREDTARRASRPGVQKVARMMSLAARKLVVGHDERAVRLATLAAKATLELSDTPCSIETTGEALGLPGGTPDSYSAFTGIVVPFDAGRLGGFTTSTPFLDVAVTLDSSASTGPPRSQGPHSVLLSPGRFIGPWASMKTGKRAAIRKRQGFAGL